jgi:hypothetical protein
LLLWFGLGGCDAELLELELGLGGLGFGVLFCLLGADDCGDVGSRVLVSAELAFTSLTKILPLEYLYLLFQLMNPPRHHINLLLFRTIPPLYCLCFLRSRLLWLLAQTTRVKVALVGHQIVQIVLT